MHWSNLRLALPVIGTALLADQLSKWWILTWVMTPPRTLEVTPFFNLVLAFNTGVSFGLFAGNDRLFLIAATLAITLALAVWMLRAQEKLLIGGLALVIGGALGNLFDRLRLGAVVDFLDLHWADLHWPAFNLADVAITIGAVLLLVDSLVGERNTGPEGGNHDH